MRVGHLEATPLALPAPVPPPRSYTFVRHASEFVASLFGGQR